MCANPAAPGRQWVLHTTDEDVTEFASTPYAADAPRHVAAIRSAKGKLALYSNWRPGTIEVEPAGQESEFYEYSGEEGRLELTPQQRAGSKLREELWATLETGHTAGAPGSAPRAAARRAPAGHEELPVL